MIRCFAICFLFLLPSSAQNIPASGTEAIYQATQRSAVRKFRHIEENAKKSPPDSSPTVLSEREINSYINSSEVKLPDGVQRAEFTGQQGMVQARALVDFDAVTGGRYSGNPLMGMFRGVHEVTVAARVSGSERQGQVHIVSVAIDGVTVPNALLEYFIERSIQPRYPGAGLDTAFMLPYKIDSAEVGTQVLNIVQK